MDGAERLFFLYTGLDRAHGVHYKNGSTDLTTGKVDGHSGAMLEPPTVAKWQRHLAGDVGIAIIPIRDDGTVRWGAIDIDKYPLDLYHLFNEVVRYDLPLVVIRSKSGGAHLTCFMYEDAPAQIMRTRLLEMAALLGHPDAEIFPKQVSLASEKDIGNWLNMPYFGGDKTDRYAVHSGHHLKLEDFLKYAEKIAISLDGLKRLNVNASDTFADGPPCLQALALNGLQPGMRNDSMFAFGVYCRLKHGDNWEAELDRINQEICDPTLPSKEVQALAKSLNKKNYHYPCSKRPIVDLCSKELCRSREFGVNQQNDELDVIIGGLVKISHDDIPTWIIDVNGRRFELSTDDLMNQARFHKRCIEKVGLWPKTIKPHQWQGMVNDRLAKIEVIDPPKDSSSEGQFLAHLEDFCLNTPPAEVREEILLGKPWEEEGFLWFRSKDLMEYLDRHRFKIKSKEAWDILRELGARHTFWNLKGRGANVWGVVPFDKQTDPFDLPNFREEEM